MRWNLSVAGLAASWGVISVIVAHVDLSAEVLAFYRVAVAAATLLIALTLARRLDLLRLRGLRWDLPLLGACLAGHWFLYFETIKLASVAVAVVTVYTAPIFLALFAPLLLPETRSRVALAALVPGAAGIVLIGLLGSESGGHARAAGIATGLGAGVTYALLVIWTKHLTRELPPVTITCWNYLGAALALAPFVAAGTGGRAVPRGGEIAYVLVLGALFTAVSGLIYVWLLGKVTAQAVGILAYLEPVSASLLAWAVLDQRLTWAVAVGGLLVVLAGTVVVAAEPADRAAVEVPAV